MKRWMKILCIVLALLAALLAGLYWWQRENLKAVKDAAHLGGVVDPPGQHQGEGDQQHQPPDIFSVQLQEQQLLKRM